MGTNIIVWRPKMITPNFFFCNSGNFWNTLFAVTPFMILTISVGAMNGGADMKRS